MRVQDRWVELLGRVERAKNKETAVPTEEARQLVAELLATAESRDFLLSKLRNADELIRSKAFLIPLVDAFCIKGGWKALENQRERQEILCELATTKAGSKKRLLGTLKKGELLWPVLSAWCLSRDFRSQEIAESIKDTAPDQKTSLGATLSQCVGWEELPRLDRAALLDWLKGKWSDSLREQAERLAAQLREMPAQSPPRLTPQPRVPPTQSPAVVPSAPPVPPVPPVPLESVTTTVDTVGVSPKPVSPDEPQPVPPPEVDGPAKPSKTKRKPESAGGESAAPLVDGLKGLVQSLNDIVRGQMHQLAERVGRLEQSATNTVREELALVRRKLEAEQELTAEERSRAQRLERELAETRQRAATAERELTAARKEIEHAAASAEQEVHTARLQAEAAVNGFRARLWGDLGPLVTQASEAEFVDRAKTPEEKIIRKWLKEIYESLRAAGVTPQSPP